MGMLAVIRISPAGAMTHEYVVRVLRQVAERAGLDAVFFMDDAASLCSKNHQVGGEIARIREAYLSLSRESGARLLCCGSAFSDLGISKDDIAEGFTLSGNFELSSLFARASGTVEF